jgi:hypothetical protein
MTVSQWRKKYWPETTAVPIDHELWSGVEQCLAGDLSERGLDGTSGKELCAALVGMVKDG